MLRLRVDPTQKMDAWSATNNCSTTTNFSGNSSLCPTVQPVPLGPMVNPYDEFFKFAFGSAIYIIIVSFVTVLANGLLLVVFFFDPLKIFRTATTYFLIGLAFVDILTAASQEPMYATCFIMMYLRHPDSLATCTPLLNVGQMIAVAAMNASFLIVLAFTFAQYIVVVSPLKYGRCVTKSRVVICVLAIYAYSIFFSLLPVIAITEEIVQKIDNIFHSITLSYVTIIVYVLLYIAFRKKMTASKSLREDKNTHGRGRDDKQTGVERKFIIINFLLIAILFFTSQPSAMLWIYRLYSNENPNTPRVLIVNLMVADNLLYLKFLLDPFLYAWRIPKYRQALKNVLRCGREEPETTFSDRVMAQVSKSRETVVTLDFKSIKD